LVFVIFGVALGQTLTVAADAWSGTGSLRAWKVATNTGATKFGFTGGVIDVNTGAQTATLDAIGFGCQNPQSAGDGVGFYFGELQGSASYTLSTTTGLTSSFSGSLAEMAAKFTGIASYLDKDSTPGFQYLVTEDQFTCSVAGVDCIPDYANGFLDFDTLTWNPITLTNTSCNGQTNAATIGDNCTVYTLTLQDSLGDIRFDVRVTTQPVTVNGVSITASESKLDVTWRFPSSYSPPSTCGGGCAGLMIAISGGKITTGSGTISKNGGQTSGHVTYDAGNGKSVYFSWDPTCTVGGTASNMISALVTSSDIKDFVHNCTSDPTGFGLNHVVACLVAGSWNAVYNVYSAFNWDLRLHFFSVTEKIPTTKAQVVWDPKFGSVDCITDSTNAVCVGTDGMSSAASSMYPFAILMASLI